MNYYKVTALRGHLGPNNGQLLVFAIAAETSYDAIQLAKRMPMVKHKSKSIKSVELISKSEYDNLRQESAYHRRNHLK